MYGFLVTYATGNCSAFSPQYGLHLKQLMRLCPPTLIPTETTGLALNDSPHVLQIFIMLVLYRQVVFFQIWYPVGRKNRFWFENGHFRKNTTQKFRQKFSTCFFGALGCILKRMSVALPERPIQLKPHVSEV
jgi:hypothetical protein